MTAKLSSVYCCDCGEETSCEWGSLTIGTVFQCPKCGVTTGHVMKNGGGSAWVRIEPSQVEFYDLLGKRHATEADDDQRD